LRTSSETIWNTLDAMPSSTTLSRWNHSTGKRLLDVACASVFLALSSPLLLVAAILVKCTSSGPTLYRHERVGKDGRPFKVLKFRTMSSNRQVAGPNLTSSGDRRVTTIGKLLRRWKVDELPQFLNVLSGEMSLVGPRPDAPQYVRQLSTDEKQILLLLPGITGAASLAFRDEETVLSRVATEQLEEFYCTEVLPAKVRLDLDYARQASFVGDLAILFRTVAAILR
jgi:lipopolysaccharide/colanic/teichoic acid biosynthesis glycosyltransferase